MSKLKKLNKLNKSKTLSVALAVGLVASNLVSVVPAFAASPASAHIMSVSNKISMTSTMVNKQDLQDVIVTMTTGNPLKGIKLGSSYLEDGTDYTVADDQVTILASYLEGLSTGSKSFKFDFDGGSDKTLRISISDKDASISSRYATFNNKNGKGKDISVTVKAYGLTLNQISNDGEPLATEDYEVGAPSSSGYIKVKILNDYLSTLPNETNDLTFEFSAGEAPVLPVRVSYNEAQPEATLKSVSAVNGIVTATLTSVPDEVGDFVVKQSIDGAAATTIASTLEMNGAVATLTVAPVVATTAEQSVVYSVSYNGGTARTATVKVAAKTDNEKPVITLKGDATMNLKIGDTFTDPGVTVTDNIDTDLVAVVTGDVVDMTKAGTYVVKYNVSDKAGNAAVEMTRTVVVTVAGLSVSSVSAINATTFDVTVAGDLTGKEINTLDFKVTVAGTEVSETVVVGTVAGHFTLTLPVSVTGGQKVVVAGQNDLTGSTELTYVANGLVSAQALTNLSAQVVLAQTVQAVSKSEFSIDGLVVEKADLSADGKTVTLTTSSQTGSKAYTVSYKGTTASFTGIAVPAFAIESVVAKNSTQVEVKFSRMVREIGTVDPLNYTIHGLDNSVVYPLTAASTVTLLGDGQTVLVDITGDIGVAGGNLGFDKKVFGASGLFGGSNNYVLYIDQTGSNDTLQDTERNPMTSNSNKSFSGKTDRDTVGPELQKASFNKSGKTLTLKFNETIAALTNLVDYAKIKVENGTSSFTLTNDDVKRVVGSDIIFDLTNTSVTAIDALVNGNQKINLAAGAVQDAVQPVRNKNVDTVLELKSEVAPVVTSATYTRETNTLKLVFDKDVNLSLFTNMAGLTLKGSNGDVTLNAGAGDKVLTTTNSKTIEIELSQTNAVTYEGITSNAVTTPKISMAAGTFTATDLSRNLLATYDINYVNDSVKPQIVNAVYDVGNNELKLTFSEKIQPSYLTTAVLTGSGWGYSTDGNSTVAFGGAIQVNATKTPANTNTKEVYITVPASGAQQAALAAGTAFLVAAGVQDSNYLTMDVIKAGNRLSVGVLNAAGPRIGGATVFGQNVIRVAFDSDLDKATAENPSNYELYLAGNQSASRRVTEAQLLADKRTVFLTVENMTVNLGYTVKGTGIKDVQGNLLDMTNDRNVANFTTGGTFTYTAPTTITVDSQIVDADASSSLNQGDIVKVYYNQPVNIVGNIDSTAFAVASGNVFGTGSLYYKGMAPNEIDIRVGAQPTGSTLLQPNDVITSTTNAKVASYWSSTTTAVAGGAGNVTLTPAETVRPVIASAVYKDVDGNAQVNAGDTLTVKYDSSLAANTADMVKALNDDIAANGVNNKLVDIGQTGANKELVIPANTTLGGIDTRLAFVAPDTIVVSLGTGADLNTAVGVQSNFSGFTINTDNNVAGITIRDGWFNKAQASTTDVTATVNGTQTTGRPYVTAAKFVNNGGAAADAGDQVVVTFSEPVTIAGTIANTEFGTVDGTAVVGATNIAQTGASEVTLYLDSTHTIGAAAGNVAVDNIFDLRDAGGGATIDEITDLEGNAAVRTTSGVKLTSGVLDADAPKLASAVAWTTVVGKTNGAGATDLANDAANSDSAPVTGITSGNATAIAPVSGDIVTIRAKKNGVQVQTTVNVTGTSTLLDVSKAIENMLGLSRGAVSFTTGTLAIDGGFAGNHVVTESLSLTLQSGATNKANFDAAFAASVTYNGTLKVTGNEALKLKGTGATKTTVATFTNLNAAQTGETRSGADAVALSNVTFNKVAFATFTTWFNEGAIGNTTATNKAKLALTNGAANTGLVDLAEITPDAPATATSVDVTYQQ